MKKYFDTNLSWIYFAIAIICCSTACEKQKKACSFGTPQAIFSPNLEKVNKHDFLASQQNATEKVIFENGIELDILQSGCDTIQQVFQTTIQGDFSQETPSYFVEMAIQLFFYLGTVSSEHFSLNYLAQTIQEKFHDIKLGKPLELQQNYFIKIDKISNLEETMLMIELSSSN